MGLISSKIFAFIFAMRQAYDPASTLGLIPIEDLQVNPKSRDDIPRVLLGLQRIWKRKSHLNRILSILQEQIGKVTSQRVGRPGMSYWRIFVLAVLKQALNCDFDRLVELANHHTLIRQMLQHDDSEFGRRHVYELQTVIDNVALIPEETWAELNLIIVEVGMEALGMDATEVVEARCDSFVVETHVRFPTDVRLLFDAIRILFREARKAWEAHQLDQRSDLAGWRQLKYLLRSLREAYRKVSTRKKREKLGAVLAYLSVCAKRIERCVRILQEIEGLDPDSEWVSRLRSAAMQAWTLHDQVARRLVHGEKIPSEEKTYSLHAPHTRWIQKGKRGGKRVELGVPVSIVENTHRFILIWQIMWTASDADLPVALVARCQRAFPNLQSMSFDRGYSSRSNMAALKPKLKHVILPKKGRRSKQDCARESAPAFQHRRRRHAQVESRINCLEQHGADRIRAKGGKAGFARTVGASVVATNLCRLGAVLMARKRSRLRKAA